MTDEKKAEKPKKKINYPDKRTFRKDRGVKGYKVLHKTLAKMTEAELRKAMQDEVDRGDLARSDLLSRLVGRFNRLRATRCTRNVMGLLAYKSSRDRNISAALDSNR